MGPVRGTSCGASGEEGGDLPGELRWEAERRRLRRYYQERGIPVYPTVERAMKALGRAIAYYRWHRKETAA